MSEINLTWEQSAAEAELRGQIIVKPKANELFVDIDSETDLDVFVKHVSFLMPHLVRTYTVKPSRSGGPRKHITVFLTRNVKSLTERLLLQAVLGSDRMRELFGFIRLESGQRDCSLFFENKK